MKQNLLLGLLFVLVIVTRTVVETAPNLEFVTASFVGAALVIQAPHWKRLLTLLAVVALSDLLLGATAIILFTWTGFAGIYLMATLASGSKRQILATLPIAVLGTVWFYLWTNLGVVLVTPLYPVTLEGLIQSYANALPFLRTQLAGNLILVPFVTAFLQLLQNAQLQVANSGDAVVEPA